jgi:SAM-dependent methyltransferase
MSRDLWFYSHFVTAANKIGRHLSRFMPIRSARILDFGCGDGFMAFGMLRFRPEAIVGVDLNLGFQYLQEIARRYIGLEQLPDTLSFHQVIEGEPLPHENNSFDAVYAWSVFEHVSDLDQVLRELHRILKDGGILFIQIEPLFHSPFGSHLKRLIPEPWAHLTMPEEALLELVMRASDNVHPEEKDLAYQTLDFKGYQRFLINEYKSLNQVTLDELTNAAGKYYNLIEEQRMRATPHIPPPNLHERYELEDLLTNEIHLTLEK